MTHQPRLFGMEESLAPLSSEESALLERYRAKRLAAGAAPPTAASEVAQLRSLRRDLVASGRATSLFDLLVSPELASRPLLEPSTSLSDNTIRTRLRATQRFLTLDTSPEEAKGRIDRLDAALGRRASRGWHDAGVVMGGHKDRKRQRPTILPDMLDRILATASKESAESAALAGVLCFSGLPLGAVCGLRWSELVWGRDQLDCEVRLGSGKGRRIYQVLGPATVALLRLYMERSGGDLGAYLFPGRVFADIARGLAAPDALGSRRGTGRRHPTRFTFGARGVVTRSTCRRCEHPEGAGAAFRGVRRRPARAARPHRQSAQGAAGCRRSDQPR